MKRILLLLFLAAANCFSVIANPQENTDDLTQFPRNIIMDVADGMRPAYTTAYRNFADEPNTDKVEAVIFDTIFVGNASTYPAAVSGYVTDSAAFNEPGTPFDSVTHVVELAPKTRRDNARFFDHVDDVPTHAITMGIAEILAAKEIFLVATGRHKAEIMARLYSSAIDEQLPASALKQHAHLRILVDAEAAELLPTHIKQVV